MAIGQRNAARRGFPNSFSAYLAWLIERDSAGAVDRERVSDPALLRVAEEPPRVYGETISPKEAKRRERRAAKKKR